MNRILIIAIVFYQKYISPFKPATCRFYPTCSDYAIQAIQRHGCLRGTLLSIKRLFRCHPYHTGGYDPVPDKLCK
ncbi:MAG: membrane protein insertion efficiency factor YidD [Atribacterota bacterium]|nr:membrane protein insertion efficiency factor YidD [Atribacterota bacterium]MDD4895964.1 membrane protein insertion efficiency factor YidD [Atribacterota bacterium]MDD5638082.1 membrane protein insertion efficiency factor YidD [Atribacterota bacterium]